MADTLPCPRPYNETPKQRPSGHIHQQIREKFESIASHMTEAATTQRRTVISPKLLKYHPSSRFHKQNRKQSESSGTDMTVAAATQPRTFISSK